ncbi:MAG: hypothetical protein HS126_22055 [Anaerolineales bacterium]|nr:hypothetical protein [Anaerolineales bacterium]
MAIKQGRRRQKWATGRGLGPGGAPLSVATTLAVWAVVGPDCRRASAWPGLGAGIYQAIRRKAALPLQEMATVARMAWAADGGACKRQPGLA